MTGLWRLSRESRKCQKDLAVLISKLEEVSVNPIFQMCNVFKSDIDHSWLRIGTERLRSINISTLTTLSKTGNENLLKVSMIADTSMICTLIATH